MLSVILASLLVTLVIAQPQTSSCAQYYSLTSQLSAIATAKSWRLTVPFNLQIQVQAGAAWDATLFKDTSPNYFAFGTATLKNGVGYATLTASVCLSPARCAHW
jgi:predicted S18 family serine protease